MRWVGGLSAVALRLASGCSSTPLSQARAGSGDISVTLLRNADQSGQITGTTYDLNAVLRFGPSYVTAHHCSVIPTGPACAVTVCSTAPLPVDDVLSAPLDAGTLSLSVNGEPVAVSNFGPVLAGAASTYSTGVGASSHVGGGEELSVHGSGGVDLPAFSTGSLFAPAPVEVTEPACPQGQCQASIAQGFPVVWTGGTPGTVQVSISAQGKDSLAAISCLYDSASGSATIPSDALALLPKSVLGAIGVSSTVESHFQLAQLDTTYEVSQLGLSATILIAP